MLSSETVKPENKKKGCCWFFALLCFMIFYNFIKMTIILSNHQKRIKKYHLLFGFPFPFPLAAPPGFFPFEAFWMSLVLSLFSKAFVLLFLSLRLPFGPAYFASLQPCLNFLLLSQLSLARFVFLSSSTSPAWGIDNFDFFFHWR